MPDLTKEQYDAEYDAEMARLNSEAAANNATITPSEEEPEPDPEPAPKPVDDPAPAPDPVDEAPETPREKDMRERLERTEKALNDTKKWANEARIEAKRLQKEQEERDRIANRPQIFDDNPGLEEAIRYAVPSAAPAPAAPTQNVDSWAETVGTALPDLDALLETNVPFREKAAAKAKELGDEWLNPIIAIRELTKLQVEQQRFEAQEQARKDFQLKGKKQAAMQVPGGGSGGSRIPAPVDEAERIRTMSSADFDAMRSKVLGH